MFKSKIERKLIALILPICVIACSLGCFVGVFSTETTTIESVEAATTVESYYAGLNENLTGDSFQDELADLITSTHKTYTSYDDLRDVFSESDADPNKSGNIIWFYSGTSVSFNGSFGSSFGTTNREHVWPKNSGDTFPASSGPGSDAHHLRPAEFGMNGRRSNHDFGEVAQTTSNIVPQSNSTNYDNWCYLENSVFYPGVGFRGATARILMYVHTRWGEANNLSLVLGKGSNVKELGDIEDLMKWHIEEPPTEAEKARNEVVYGIQGNRNPFIDHPEYAEMIYCYDGENYNDELQNVVKNYGSYLDGSVGGTIEPEKVEISQSSVNMVKGETFKLEANVYPAGASSSLTWTSSSPSVASVDKGVVTALGAGTTTITATSTVDSSIKDTVTITVKAVTSLEVTGTPVKLTYTAGDTFNPAGLTVKATYTDSSTATIPNEDCSWLDGTTNQTTLSQGTTSVICSYGGATKTINGLTVKQGTTKSITITRDSFGSGSSYAWVDWSAGGISGQGFMYPGEKNSIQMNTTNSDNRKAQYIFNTTPLAGGIVSITIKTSVGKNWSVLTSTTPYDAHDGTASGGTTRGTIASTSDGGTLEIGTTDQYFAINYASTGAAYITEIIIVYGSAHSHTVGAWIEDKAPTCAEEGIKHNECTECGEIVDIVVLPALEHSYGDWTETKAPTCTTDGEESSYCSSCKQTITRTIARLGHDLEEVEDSYIAPTCTANGYESTYACVRVGCDHTEVGASIPATGHSYGEWNVTTEPTCEAEGVETRTCGTCSHSETRVVEKAPHAFGEWVGISDNMEQRECADCGEIEERAKANLEKVQAFVALVEAVEQSNTMSAKWSAIYEALEAYNELSDSEKDAVYEEYQSLAQAINSYNQTAESINQESQKATSQAILFYIGAISALAFAGYFLLKI
ncbi:MAG: endonuclease [Clostridia bacterium]|nr:endonuclease [Clostridia bacterium]